MKTKLSKRIVSVVVTGCLFLSLGTVALANNGPGDQPPRHGVTAEPGMPPDPANSEQHIGNMLSKLIKEGTISKEQADKIKDFFKQKAEQHVNHAPDFIGELRSKAELSEEQAKAVADALRPPHRPNKPVCECSGQEQPPM
ncbi:hypothetical protein [Sporomusa sp.]|uniref:hypothetical protein n=1 Tax=Sporomusa sp. TaxID=2078658 RepID=UPI002C61F527|nr:hypothetical protein [Sporomusa sp.]HWR44994.1 hypothetical protein [Sporomusa sp.]